MPENEFVLFRLGGCFAFDMKHMERLKKVNIQKKKRIQGWF